MAFWNGRKVLVTGGCGLIGSYLVEHLVDQSAKVRVADNLQSGSLDHVASCLDRIEMMKVDLRDAASCDKAAQGMDAVFDLAARTVGIGYSRLHHGEMFHDSMTISMNMIEAARRAGVRRFQVTSSSCVYPDVCPVPTPEDAAERNTPEQANAGYGWAKRMAELQGIFYAQEYGMEVAIIRLVNAYGPRYHWEQEEPHVIPSLIQRLLNGERPLRIWGSGKQTRSFIHASDAAKLMMLTLERAANATPMNIGVKEETRIADLVAELTAIAGFQGSVEFDTTKPEGPARKALDLSRQEKLIPDFYPRITLREGLRETYEAAIRHYAGRKTGVAASRA